MSNYAAIYEADCANGVGCRTSVFLSGCRHHCKGCFNEEAWDFEYGKPFTQDVFDYIRSTLDNDHIDGISILGGEPFEWENQETTYNLVDMTKALHKSVWIYTGCIFEKLHVWGYPWNNKGYTDDILERADVIVDGPFILEQKDVSLKYRGSRNQRIIDVQKSFVARKVILWNEKGVSL